MNIQTHSKLRDAQIVSDRRRAKEHAEALCDATARPAVHDVSEFFLEMAVSRMDPASKLRDFLEQYNRCLDDHINRPDEVDTDWLEKAFDYLREELHGYA